MEIDHNYNYLGNGQELIEKGYAKLGVQAIIFDRYFSEEEKVANAKISNSVTNEEWNNYCNKLSERIHNQLKPIVELLGSKYDIHQINKEKSSMEHYITDWDLFFYSNRVWNGQDYYDYVRLSFNDGRSAEQNDELFNEIIALLETIQVNNVQCIIQYEVILDEEKIEAKALEICEKLLGKTIEYNNMKGKIKTVPERNTVQKYGFFKSRAKKYYYNISNRDLVLNFA